MFFQLEMREIKCVHACCCLHRCVCVSVSATEMLCEGATTPSVVVRSGFTAVQIFKPLDDDSRTTSPFSA